jgi:hypothetical protein
LSPPPIRRIALFLGALFLFLTAARLCHTGTLWSDGDYHLAAAMQVHDGKALYRDLWYDKPPLTALVMDLLGRPEGWRLSVAEAFLAWTACLFAFLAGREIGGLRAGALAAALMAFYLTFYIPTAVIPIAPDLLMITPHLAAVYCAFAKRPLWAGLSAGIAFWINVKGAFVLLACLAIAPTQVLALLAGFAIPSAAGVAALAATGAWNAYFDQVWRWSLLYARSSPLAHPWVNALARTANWAGFHAALLLGAALYFRKRGNANWLRLAFWIAISFVAVAQGMRFLPRYYFQLLAPLTVVAGLGFSVIPRRVWITAAAAIALAIPLIRFGPAYVTLATEDLRGRPHGWADLALDRDDQAVAAMLNARKARQNTLFVWGYRPGIYVYAHLDSPSLFWDSQPLTGVPADRHLTSAVSVDPDGARRNRVQFASAAPTFLVDSLSRFNPALAVDRYPDLQPLLARYRRCGETALSTVYCAR